MTSQRGRYSPDNTTNYDAFAKLLVGAEPGGIEDMERRGQQQLLEATTLPTDTRGKDADFIALGFTFGEQVPGDPLFREATLPEGWSRKGTDHAMGSEIVDERGIGRVSIFYKAAYYDRKADMSITNVGYMFATKWLYGDVTPELNPLFTADELRSILQQVERGRDNADRSPTVYGDQLPRLASLEAAATARLAEVEA